MDYISVDHAHPEVSSHSRRKVYRYYLRALLIDMPGHCLITSAERLLVLAAENTVDHNRTPCHLRHGEARARVDHLFKKEVAGHLEESLPGTLGVGNQHITSDIEQHQADNRVQQQDEFPGEGDIVQDAEHEEHAECQAEVDEGLDVFGKQEKIQLETGAHVLPHFVQDSTDRNRTSPFAFTGNKFEFRMLGSSASVATPNIVLNTAVAEALAQFYQELEGTRPEDIEHAVHELLKRAIRKHKKIIFNGNGYSEEWVKEAESRGLYNLVSTPDCLPRCIVEKNVELFTKHHIFTKDEIFSRYEILLENYVKTILIEAKTLEEMLSKDFLPSVSAFAGQTAENATAKKAFLPALSTPAEEALVTKLTETYTALTDGIAELASLVTEAESMDDMQKAAEFCQSRVLSRMEALRLTANAAETLIPDSLLPYPTYDQLLFSL